jgi:hypothetical protein
VVLTGATSNRSQRQHQAGTIGGRDNLLL